MNIPFTQTKEYLSWHEAVGTKTFYKEFFRNGEKEKVDEVDFQIDGEEKENLESRKFAVVASIVIELRIGKVLYVPYGPVFFGTKTVMEINEVLKYLKDLAKQENCVFVRLENSQGEKKLWPSGEINRTYTPAVQNFFSPCVIITPPKRSFAKEGVFQPRVEWWLDLKESEENLLNRVHKDHRYSIRRSQKENIQVEIVNIDEDLNNVGKEKYFAEFWKLIKVTGERDGFGLYEEKYYEEIINSHAFQERVKKFLVFTKLDNKYLSVALVVISDKVANLVFAGSVSEKREFGFNHLMQWEAIRFSKALGCEIYNFGGIHENGYGKKGLLGVTNFKKRFGGYAKFHGNFIDIPIKKVKYVLYVLKKLL